MGDYSHDLVWTGPVGRQHTVDAPAGHLFRSVHWVIRLGSRLGSTCLAKNDGSWRGFSVGSFGTITNALSQWVTLGPFGIFPIPVAPNDSICRHHRRLRRVLSHRVGEYICDLSHSLEDQTTPS